MSNIKQCWGLPVLAAVCLSACAMPPANVDAAVNGVPESHVPQISAEQLDEAVRESGKPDSAALRASVRQTLINRELVLQAAQAEHDDVDPVVEQAVDNARTNGEIQAYLRRHIQPQAVTEAQARERYDRIAGTLGKTDYKVRLISVRGDDAAQMVSRKLAAGERFEELAREYSVAPSKAQGGELPWVNFREPISDGQAYALPVPVARAITTLSVGDYTRAPVVSGEFRVFVRLEYKRPAVIPQFEQVRSAVTAQLQAEMREQAIAALLQKLAQQSSVVH